MKNKYLKLQSLARKALNKNNPSKEEIKALGILSTIIIMEDFIKPSIKKMNIHIDNYVSERKLHGK